MLMQSSKEEDVNRLLHPCASSLCSYAARHSEVQDYAEDTRNYQRASRGQ